MGTLISVESGPECLVPLSLGPVGCQARGSNRRVLLGVTSLLALPLLLLADTLAAFCRGWETNARIDWLLMISIGAVVVATIGVVYRPVGRSFIADHAPQLMLCVAAVAVTWLSVEFLVHAFGVPAITKHPHRRPRNTVSVFHPVPGVMPGIEGESRFTINSLGIRGPELPSRDSAYRILCIGGSTTECLYLDDTESWPKVLMDHFNLSPVARHVWVGNLGKSGYSTVDHLNFLLEDSIWKEMDCLLFMVGANDLGGFLRFGITMKSPSDKFWDREKHLRTLAPVWRKSAVLETVRGMYGQWNVPRLLIEDEAGANYAVRRKMRQEAALRDDFPDLSAALDQYGKRIARLITLCKSAGVRPIFLTQPTLMKGHTSPEVAVWFWSGDDGQGRYFKIGQLKASLDEYNHTLKTVCERENVVCVDLASINDHAEYFYDEYHFNEAGARAVAQLVASGIEQERGW